jgi:lipopolysaccharide transport system permease protein
MRLKELWSYRELFLFLVWRDILVRYKQTVLGVAWVVVRPLLMMGVFTILFGKVAGLPSQGAPYPILVFSAIIPWQFFSDSLFFGNGSLIANPAMISKIYFPRIFIPTSSVVCSFIDSFVSICLLFLLLLYYNYFASLSIITVLICSVWCFIISFATTIFFAALTVRYRDFKYVVAFFVQLGLYVSPVGFSSSVIPHKWRLLFSLNPMVGVIDGFRSAILGDALYLPGMCASLFVTLICLVVGIAYFRYAQDSFADVI